MNNIRCEADLYGYSKYLADFLNYDFAPLSLRGFQHGWIWWDPNDFEPSKSFGLDPNTSEYWGILVQDSSVADSLLKRGIFALPCGLPFLNWIRHMSKDVNSSENRSSEVLYVPSHSNPWIDISSDVRSRAIRFSERYKGAQILLGGNDSHLANELSAYYSKVHIGASVSDTNSFARLLSAFNSCYYMITDAIGSHICYALHCGMKVGLHTDFYDLVYGPQPINSTDFHRLNRDQLSGIQFVSSLKYLQNRFRGLLVSDQNLPIYSIAPEISDCSPCDIAHLLGWDITYACELPKHSFQK